MRPDLLLGLLFFLSAIISQVPYCLAITFEVTYEDAQGSGFYDETELTEEQKALLSEAGNGAQTLGEARRNAFEYAAGLLADKLGGDTTVNVEASFVRRSSFLGLMDYRKLVKLPGGSDLSYPMSLAEAISGEELNGDEPEAGFKFSKNYDFYYGFELETPQDPYDFVEVVMHEIIHALGHRSSMNAFGYFLTTVEGTEEIQVFDAQLYSEQHGELLVNLPRAKRVEVATSGTGLLWEGTTGGGTLAVTDSAWLNCNQVLW